MPTYCTYLFLQDLCRAPCLGYHDAMDGPSSAEDSGPRSLDTFRLYIVYLHEPHLRSGPFASCVRKQTRHPFCRAAHHASWLVFQKPDRSLLQSIGTRDRGREDCRRRDNPREPHPWLSSSPALTFTTIIRHQSRLKGSCCTSIIA